VLYLYSATHIETDLLRLVTIEGIHRVSCLGQSREQVTAESTRGCIDLTLVDTEFAEHNAIETLGELPHCDIATKAYLAKDGAHIGDRPFGAKIRAGKVEGVARRAIAKIKNLHHGR
jgi:hypothetical protein